VIRQIDIQDAVIGDSVKGRCPDGYKKGRAFGGSIKAIDDDSVTVLVTLNGRGMRRVKILNQDIIKVFRIEAA
jgi:hypothetical protein